MGFKRTFSSVILIFGLVGGLWAAGLSLDLAQMGLSDQWDQPLANPSEVRWLLVSGDKAAHSEVHEYFNEQGADWLQRQGLVYLSDISAMPSLITKMFALPKMRKYQYPLYLDRSGEQVGPIQPPQGKLLLVELANGQAQSDRLVSSLKELLSALESP
ncbi:MAG: hypothetical protein RRB13_05765 [bacterium]|nr:hypothetical protein [bacterium]